MIYGTENDFKGLLKQLSGKTGKVLADYKYALTEAQGAVLYAMGWMCGGTGEFYRI